MKISYRILIINFAIVAVILVSAAVGFYSIVYNVLSSQQQKYLLNSANVFLYAYREMLQDTEDDLVFMVRNNSLSFQPDNRLTEKKYRFHI